MKKVLAILAIAATAATMVMADVESKNVVGFEKIGLTTNKYNQFGWQFALVGGETNILINSVTNYSPFKASVAFGAADQLRVWSPFSAVYSNYYRYSATTWRKQGGASTTTDKIKLGDTVMFFKQGGTGQENPCVLVEAGEVLNTNFYIVVFTNKYTLLSNPFPMALPVNSVTNYTPYKASVAFGAADQLRKWYPSAGVYSNYYRYSATAWRRQGAGATTTDVLAPGEGFMFFKQGGTGQGTAPYAVMTFITPVP